MTMTTFHFQTHVSDRGVITLPPDAKDFYGANVSVNVGKAIKPKRKATPQEVQQFMDTCYGCLEGFTDEEFEQMKSDDWQPDPAVVREFFENRIPLDVQLTDDEIETLKHERRMRRML
jgi:hypothetical protein